MPHTLSGWGEYARTRARGVRGKEEILLPLRQWPAEASIDVDIETTLLHQVTPTGKPRKRTIFL
jgi:hypothetical protein